MGPSLPTSDSTSQPAADASIQRWLGIQVVVEPKVDDVVPSVVLEVGGFSSSSRFETSPWQRAE
jgi:hypothetical protein